MKNFERQIPVYTVVLNPPAPPKPPKELFPVPEEFHEDNTVIVDEIAGSALKWENARKISIIGDALGAVLLDGSEDVVLKVTVKTSDRAVKDANGNEISKVYARKAELEKYALKSEIQRKLNYLEKIIYATKEAVNESLREKDLDLATNEELDNLFDYEVPDNPPINDTKTDDDSPSNDENNMATVEDIDALFGGN